MAFGEPTEETSYNFGGDAEVLVIFDTGTSFVMVPDYFWKFYVDHLITVADLTDTHVVSGFLTFPCKQ